MSNKPLLLAVLCVAGLNAGPPLSAATAAADDRRYCLSDICLGDSHSVLSGLTLTNLARVAERPRARSREYRDAFKTAAPGLSDAERMALSAYADSKGSLLLDARTLPIFLKIGAICAPVGPFVGLFTSESGHQSSAEFGATMSGSAVRLGVTRVARSYQVAAGSAEEAALIADLSRRFGFRIDAAPEQQLDASGRRVTVEFMRQEKGFLLAFSGPALRKDSQEFAEQAGCDRIKID
jgi:hypothetical protein